MGQVHPVGLVLLYKGGWIFSRDTEKPNLSGYSANRRLNNVDFPVPDGPEITTGRKDRTIYMRKRERGVSYMFFRNR